MACYSDRTKKCCSVTIIIVSFILFILGVVILLIGGVALKFLAIPEDIDFEKFMPGVKIDNNTISVAILAVGGAVMSLSILGCLVVKCKNPFFATPFILLTFVLGSALVLTGTMIFMAKTSIPTTLKEAVCEKGSFANLDFDEAVTKYVCSEICPCPEGPSGDWKTLWNSYDPAYIR